MNTGVTSTPRRPTSGSPTDDTGRRLHGSTDPGAVERTHSSRVLHRAGDASARASAGVLVALALLVWFLVGAFTRFPTWWQVVLYSVSASLTLVMVFALQHVQSRLESATQRKLDEIIRALPTADNALIALEEATDAELAARADLDRVERLAGSSGGDSLGPAR